MENLRIIRTLRKELQNRFPEQDGTFLAERLYEAGITELTDEVIEKLNYLQSICKDFSLDSCSWLVVSLPKTVLMERYDRFVSYCGDKKCEVSALKLSEEKFEQYSNFFKEIEMSEEQCKKALGMVIRNGIILKSIAEAKVAVNELGNFHISVEERNRFITDNGDMLFNDYSRKISENVRKLIDCYGETEAYAKLKEHPEVLRIGLD